MARSSAVRPMAFVCVLLLATPAMAGAAVAPPGTIESDAPARTIADGPPRALGHELAGAALPVPVAQDTARANATVAMAAASAAPATPIK